METNTSRLLAMGGPTIAFEENRLAEAVTLAQVLAFGENYNAWVTMHLASKISFR